jgi:hypothetical protein
MLTCGFGSTMKASGMQVDKVKAKQMKNERFAKEHKGIYMKHQKL